MRNKRILEIFVNGEKQKDKFSWAWLKEFQPRILWTINSPCFDKYESSQSYVKTKDNLEK